jgi:hypothetical protein
MISPTPKKRRIPASTSPFGAGAFGAVTERARPELRHFRLVE